MNKPRSAIMSAAREVIEQLSTIGAILKMMPCAAVDDDVLKRAEALREPGQTIGDALLAMHAVTHAQLARALGLQATLRACKSCDEVDRFFAEVREATSKARDALFAAIPAVVIPAA